MAPLETLGQTGDAAQSAWRSWALALMLAAATLAAYHNTFSVPFLFDDIPAIARNPTLRDLRWSSELLAPGASSGSGAAGRPMVNLSLALNRALGGDDVRGYHALNLLIHLGAGLALLGVVRRTLRAMGTAAREAERVAFAVALLWLVHPLQTESVTGVIQRTESLMGFFFLLTLYFFVRSIALRPSDDKPQPAAGEQPAVCHLIDDKSLGGSGVVGGGGGRGRGGAWRVACFVACALGAATKEVMATAPIIVLLYDRTFVAGTFRDALRRRGGLHAALASTWVLIAALVWRSQTRGGTVGFGHGVAWWEYALTQCRAVAMYLKLALWPSPLVLDYGTDVVRGGREVWPQALLLATLAGATLWAFVRRPIGGSRRWAAVGFLGAWFFVILAPSSSVVPLVTQTMAEHRMYLPLAAIVAGVVLALHALVPRWSLVSCVALAAALGVATERRNADYRSAESIWRDTVAKRPGNARAHYALAQLAADAGRADEAIAQGEIALRLQPADPAAHFNLAFDLERTGRLDEARARYAEAAALRPEAASAHINLASVLAKLGRLDEAIAQARIVVRLQPESGEDQFNLGQMLAAAGRFAEALPHCAVAARRLPNFADAHYRLGHVLVQLGRAEEAAGEFGAAVRLAPQHFEAHMNLAGALLVLGRPAEAIPVYEAALRLRPDDPLARTNLALARERAGR